MAVYVVTSTVPEGRSDAVEFDSLLALEHKFDESIGDQKRYSMTKSQAAWGPMINMRMTNFEEHNSDGPFPLVRPLLKDPNSLPHTRSIHRLFVHESRRFEVVAMGVPEQPGNEESELKLESQITKYADQLVASLQECTNSLSHTHQEP